MANINDLFLWVQDVWLNKQQSSEISDTTFNEAIALVNLQLFRRESGIEQDYEIGKAIPRIGWQLTNLISDNLRPFITPVTIAKVGDYFPYPTDKGIFSTLEYDYIKNSTVPGGQPTLQTRTIEPLTDEEFRFRKQSTIKPPSLYWPCMTWSSAGYEVAPTQIQNVKLVYLRVPKTPFRAFTQLGNDETQYDPNNSIQLEWPQTMYPLFAAMTCLELGINIRSGEIIAVMNQKVKEG